MRGRSLILFSTCVAAAAWACTVVAVDGENPPPGGDDASTSGGEGGPRADGSSADGPGDLDGGSDACMATGALAFDPTFAQKTIPLSQIRAAPAPGGRFAVFGGSNCADGGAEGVELRFLEPNGDPSPVQPPCLDEGNEIVESITPRASGGWDLGTSVGNGVYNAVLRTVGSDGLLQNTRTRNGNFHKLATQVGAATVWAGYRDQPAPDGTGWLGIAGGALNDLAGERVVAAGARGSDLFALVVTVANPPGPSITLRKYLVAGSVNEDTVVRSQPVALSPGATSFAFTVTQRCSSKERR